MVYGEEFGGFGVGEADDIGHAGAGFEWGLVDVFFAALEMPRGVHVGAAVGIEVEHFGVPSVFCDGAVLG